MTEKEPHQMSDEELRVAAKLRGLDKSPVDQLVDQIAHFLAGAVIVLAFFVVPLPYSGAVVGLLAGAIREVTEGGNVLSKGSLLDVAFWTLGGFATTLLLELLR